MLWWKCLNVLACALYCAGETPRCGERTDSSGVMELWPAMGGTTEGSFDSAPVLPFHLSTQSLLCNWSVQLSAMFSLLFATSVLSQKQIGENRSKFGVLSLPVVPLVKFQGLHLLMGLGCVLKSCINQYSLAQTVCLCSYE